MNLNELTPIQQVRMQNWIKIIRECQSSGLTNKEWCDDNILKTLSGTKIYKAFSYALNHKEGLCEYINDGYLPMTNSLDERTIRPFAIGRKNWLFSTSVDGAKSSAVAYSIVSTAKANGVDPYKYLTYVFRQMPGSDFKKHPEILEYMMPWDSKIQELCKNTL